MLHRKLRMIYDMVIWSVWVIICRAYSALSNHTCRLACRQATNLTNVNRLPLPNPQWIRSGGMNVSSLVSLSLADVMQEWEWDMMTSSTPNDVTVKPDEKKSRLVVVGDLQETYR